jgi:glycosyltransferase involved in cell wall biosynthesis
VGPGDRFLSGVSYYTSLLAAALGARGAVSMLLLRKICPRAAYPGRARVGRTDGTLKYPEIPTFNGLDWYWGLSALRALRFWRRVRPTVVVLQWWTGTVLHSYLAIAWLAKRVGARLVVEFHEVQDVGEARLPLAKAYAGAGMRFLLGHSDAVVVHSEFDRRAVLDAYPQLAELPVEVIPHGPYAQYRTFPGRVRGADDPLRLLTFGVVRPYKGHSEIAAAVRLLAAAGMDVHMTVVGEVWQGYRAPLDQLASILPENRLTVVDRYVADAEVPGFFAAADMVVLPYRRSSASGPLHIAMSCGLPVVTTAVGGLVEAAADYSGAVLVKPGDPVGLAEGIRKALPLVGLSHSDPHSWSRTGERYEGLLNRIHAGWAVHEAVSEAGVEKTREPSVTGVYA